jgi:DNA-binding CsgD family transcriptional regulator
MLELLTPHLVTAFRTTKRIQEMEGRIQGLEGMLDVVSTGILMLDERGRVLEANRYAREVMGAGDGLGVDREGRLRGGGGRLARAVQCVTRGEDVPAGGCAVRVERPSGMEPYAVMVGPVEGMVLEKARAMVMVSDPAREPGIGIREIGGMLGLTDAEARVAAGLMAGRSLADVADALGVSMNTVRTHVKRIFEKTRTSRQGQLVAMMLRSGMGMVR